MTFDGKKRVFIENFQTQNKLSIYHKHYCSRDICQSLNTKKDAEINFLFVINTIVVWIYIGR